MIYAVVHQVGDPAVPTTIENVKEFDFCDDGTLVIEQEEQENSNFLLSKEKGLGDFPRHRTEITRDALRDSCGL